MSQQTITRTAEQPSLEIPAELDSAPSKLVYLYLRTRGECTIDDLEASLDMRKISLFPLLKSLSKKGLVDCDGEVYRPA